MPSPSCSRHETGHQLTHQVYLRERRCSRRRWPAGPRRRSPDSTNHIRPWRGQLFLRLVTVRSAGEATRRRARLVELNALGDPGEVGTVLATFGDARLLVFDRDPISRSPSAEVAHEALLTSWPRLAGWLDEAGEDLLLHGRLRDGLAEWEDRDREAAYLLHRWPTGSVRRLGGLHGPHVGPLRDRVPRSQR